VVRLDRERHRYVAVLPRVLPPGRNTQHSVHKQVGKATESNLFQYYWSRKRPPAVRTYVRVFAVDMSRGTHILGR
jgi:hypothetical protein